MARFAPEEITDAISLNNRGYNLPEIARMFGRDVETLREGLKLRGIKLMRHYRASHNAKDCDEESLVRDFLNGQSVLALSRAYGLTRAGVERRLRRNGVSKRDRSTANKVSMSQMPKEQRMKRVKGAHQAVRGREMPHEEKVARALTRYKTKAISYGDGEAELEAALQSASLPFDTQYPIDIHNIDALVFDSVIVEVTTTGIARYRTEEYRERTKHLMEFGFDFIGVTARDGFAITINSDDLIADIKEISRNPAPGSQYRVVRCSYNRSTCHSFNPDKASSIEPAVQPVYTRYQGETL